jgi:hypothetical protein
MPGPEGHLSRSERNTARAVGGALLLGFVMYACGVLDISIEEPRENEFSFEGQVKSVHGGTVTAEVTGDVRAEDDAEDIVKEGVSLTLQDRYYDADCVVQPEGHVEDQDGNSIDIGQLERDSIVAVEGWLQIQPDPCSGEESAVTGVVQVPVFSVIELNKG